MVETVILKKAGTKSEKRIDIDSFLKGVCKVLLSGHSFKLVKSNRRGRDGGVKEIYHEWAMAAMVEGHAELKDDWLKIFEYTQPVREELLRHFYGVWYLPKGQFDSLYEEFKRMGIEIDYDEC